MNHKLDMMSFILVLANILSNKHSDSGGKLKILNFSEQLNIAKTSKISKV